MWLQSRSRKTEVSPLNMMLSHYSIGKAATLPNLASAAALLPAFKLQVLNELTLEGDIQSNWRTATQTYVYTLT